MHFRTTEEMLNAFAYLGKEKAEEIVITNSNKIADMCQEFNFLPAGKKYPKIENQAALLREICVTKANELYGNPVPANIMERLELKIRPLTKELRYYFTGKTTIDTDADFIVFNIRELMNADSNIRNALFFNILKYAWGLTLDREINTILMVDEAHMLLADQNTLGAEFLARIQRRSRKYNTGTIIITQQPTDFAAPNVVIHGKAIFDNASYYLVMGLRKQAVDDLAKLVDLNDQEKDSIKRYSQGQALFVCGSRRMRINVIATQQELESFGSGGGL